MITTKLNTAKSIKFRDSVENFSFESFSNSWVAIHPNPKGIIQFIGSFVFGSFPIKFYRYLLQNLFEQGYTIFVFRFPFTPLKFDHWQFTTELLKEEYALRVEIIRFLKKNHKTSDNNLEIYLNDSNYYWLGHSLGCKYITLLEILSNDVNQRELFLQKSLANRYNHKLLSQLKSVDIARENAEREISKILNRPIKINQYFIQNQPSILLAPEISNTVTVNGITIPTAKPLSKFELLVSPNLRETKSMIAQSTNLFNLTGIISFSQDFIARDDVNFLCKQLSLKSISSPLHKEFFGWHLDPNAVEIKHLGACINRFFGELIQR